MDMDKRRPYIVCVVLALALIVFIVGSTPKEEWIRYANYVVRIPYAIHDKIIVDLRRPTWRSPFEDTLAVNQMTCIEILNSVDSGLVVAEDLVNAVKHGARPACPFNASKVDMSTWLTAPIEDDTRVRTWPFFDYGVMNHMTLDRTLLTALLEEIEILLKRAYDTDVDGRDFNPTCDEARKILLPGATPHDIKLFTILLCKPTKGYMCEEPIDALKCPLDLTKAPFYVSGQYPITPWAIEKAIDEAGQ